MSRNEFRIAFVARLKQDWRAVQENNFDRYRFPLGIVGPSRWRWYARRFGGERLRSAWRALRVVRQSANLQWLYEILGDDQSRQLLIDVMAYRALGSRHVRLSLNNSKFWTSLETIERDLLRSARTHYLPDGTSLDDYDLKPLAMPVKIRGHILNVLNSFVLEQYRFARNGRVIEVEAGDTVIDAGGCWGDTALYFALKAGKDGTVFSYEFDASNLELFRHNLEQNAHLSHGVRIVKKAIWSESGRAFDVAGSGANTHLVAAKHGTGSVNSDTIDDLVRRENIKRVDFIKMDIEGSELDALKGAEVTLRSDRPKLAISIYHRLEHFWLVPQYINSLGLGYQFFIDHFTIHAEETMLFAVAPGSRGKSERPRNM